MLYLLPDSCAKRSYPSAIDSVSSVPEFKRLVDYLQADCEFMQTCEEEYRDAV